MRVRARARVCVCVCWHGTRLPRCLELRYVSMMTIQKTSRKKGKRKVQGVPQSQTAALPGPQEEEETDKSYQKANVFS